MRNGVKSAGIVIFLTLALVATIFSVQKGVNYLLRAQVVEPTPTPTTPSPIPFPTQPSTYTLQDYQEFLNAMGTSDSQWDLNGDGVVNQADLTIFKSRYQP